MPLSDCNARPRGLCQALSNRLTAFDNSWALQFVRSNFEILPVRWGGGAAGCPSDWQRSAIPIFISSFVENREKIGKRCARLRFCFDRKPLSVRIRISPVVHNSANADTAPGA
jgi:hypothetical protein